MVVCSLWKSDRIVAPKARPIAGDCVHTTVVMPLPDGDVPFKASDATRAEAISAAVLEIAVSRDRLATIMRPRRIAMGRRDPVLLVVLTASTVSRSSTRQLASRFSIAPLDQSKVLPTWLALRRDPPRPTHPSHRHRQVQAQAQAVAPLPAPTRVHQAKLRTLP